MPVSPAAIAAAWHAYDQETWAEAETTSSEGSKERCMRKAIEAAAKVDGVEWASPVAQRARGPVAPQG